jgi:hypothetical protein
VSLDKLLDLIFTQQLFFAPLSFFVNTDPFEGYLPAASMNALGEVFRGVITDVESSVRQVEDHCARTQRQLPENAREMLRHKLDDLKETPKRFFQAIRQCQVVNCWHANEVESEAMWRLYADNGKAVAIETTVDALRESIESQESQYRVHIYRVKYLDFLDKTLKPSDCVVDGHTTPLLKRLSYKHENEVRVFIGRVPNNPREAANINYWRPAPVRLGVDVNMLVKRVHISPYASEPFENSVNRICELLGMLSGIVVPSQLLSGQEELLKPFEY